MHGAKSVAPDIELSVCVVPSSVAPEEEDSGSQCVASSQCASRRVLTSKVSGQLRGVRIERALQGFGQHWAGGVTGGLGCSTRAEEDYALSEDVSELDDFVSHDWLTGRWHKYFSMLLIYNGRAALAANLIAAFLFGTIKVVLPSIDFPAPYTVTAAGSDLHADTGPGSILVGFLVFWIVLVFWQQLRLALFRDAAPTYAFVDKLCIHQTDSQLKAEAILRLAGFLRESNRLVVLWSPRYLSRLWCVYEVATWEYLNHQVEGVERPTFFMPVTLALGLLSCTLSTTALYLLVSFLELWVPRGSLAERLPSTVACNALCLLFPLHALRRFVRDLKCMPEQLATFSVRDAVCFCCTHGHRHPTTGETIPCDRQLVYSVLVRWFSEEGKDLEACLDNFDHCIRTNFGPQLLKRMRVWELKYWQVMIICGPLWCYCADRLLPCFKVWQQAGGVVAARMILEHLTVAAFVGPIVMQVCWRSAFYVDSLFGVQKNAVLDIGVTLLYTCWILVIEICTWAPNKAAVDRPNAAAQVVVFVALLLWVCILFSDGDCWKKIAALRRQASQGLLPGLGASPPAAARSARTRAQS